MMRSVVLATLFSALPLGASAQTADELKNDEKTAGDVSPMAWAIASSASAR
jgi:hypothetical protein